MAAFKKKFVNLCFFVFVLFLAMPIVSCKTPNIGNDVFIEEPAISVDYGNIIEPIKAATEEAIIKPTEAVSESKETISKSAEAIIEIITEISTEPQIIESITELKGLNGYHEETYNNGDKYGGNFVNGIRSGQGLYTWADGTIYEGEFVDGNPSGKGTYIYPTTEPPLTEPSTAPPTTEPAPKPTDPPALPVENMTDPPQTTEPPPPVNVPVAGNPDDYFNNSVFVGDSVMECLAQYVRLSRNSGSMLGNAFFLTSIIGIRIADCVGDMGNETIYYSYKGMEISFDQCIAGMNVNKIFIMLGMNDLSFNYSIEETIERYNRLLDKIYNIIPDIDITILSVTPRTASNWLPWYCRNQNFGNPLIDEFNLYLVKMCNDRGVKYIDLNSPLKNGGASLPADYCSDGYLHLSKTGSAVVVKVLREFAERNG